MFQKIQDEVNELEDFITQHSRSSQKDTVFILLTHLLSECGEAADEIKGLEGVRAESPELYSRDELAKELVDIVFNALRIARRYNISLDDYFLSRLKSIRKKFQ